MVKRMPHIDHSDKVCESSVLNKHHKASFAKKETAGKASCTIRTVAAHLLPAPPQESAYARDLETVGSGSPSPGWFWWRPVKADEGRPVVVDGRGRDGDRWVYGWLRSAAILWGKITEERSVSKDRKGFSWWLREKKPMVTAVRGMKMHVLNKGNSDEEADSCGQYQVNNEEGVSPISSEHRWAYV
ncbi:hypothetical protein NC652_040680 [Populus alba x Populus x berolinensis]|nr:hypothetical protein NC652_040680 [Populus alba x Populus x berolinensis]